MIRKALILSSFLVLLAAESVYFVRASVAALFRLDAQRAFFRNDHPAAWSLNQRALAWGGNPDAIETDLIELINFGLDQSEAGVKVDLPLPPEQLIPLARKLSLRRIHETPYRAYCWSLASDVSMREAGLKRRATVFDLTSLSEDPIENLIPEERNAIAELKAASSLEPVNFIYHDLLMDLYTGFGAMQEAAASCRRAVGAFPYLDSHRYLWRHDLPPEMLEAAIGGFDDALLHRSLVSRATILVEAGRLLAWHGQDDRAERYFARCLELSPRSFDALIETAMIRLRRKDNLGALDFLKLAAQAFPEDPSSDYYSGVTYMNMGQTESAIRAFESSREKGFGDMRILHGLGAALEADGQIQEAERQFAAAANLNPEVSEGWSALLDFQLRHRNIRAAQEACSRLARLNGGKGISNSACESLERELR